MQACLLTCWHALARRRADALLLRARWVKITPEYIAFGISAKHRPISQIFFEDVIGVAFDGVDLEAEPDVWFRTVPQVEKEKEQALAIKLQSNVSAHARAMEPAIPACMGIA